MSSGGEGVLFFSKYLSSLFRSIYIGEKTARFFVFTHERKNRIVSLCLCLRWFAFISERFHGHDTDIPTMFSVNEITRFTCARLRRIEWWAQLVLAVNTKRSGRNSNIKCVHTPKQRFQNFSASDLFTVKRGEWWFWCTGSRSLPKTLCSKYYFNMRNTFYLFDYFTIICINYFWKTLHEILPTVDVLTTSTCDHFRHRINRMDRIYR